ncbi:soluble NSF attachment protein [Phycomyces nitens]|nr:soluble NSF attachment protein [Phycomyces nitens]
MAEIYESDIVDLERAMEHWEEAAQMYIADDSQAMVNKCLLKVAHFAAQLEQYKSAIDKFETVATASIDNPLTKWSLKEYFLKAGLCHFCIGDIVSSQQALEKYCNLDVTFESTREYQFLQGILECIEEDDTQLFTQKVYEFDQMTKLDNWKTSILLKIKKSIEEPSLR